MSLNNYASLEIGSSERDRIVSNSRIGDEFNLFDSDELSSPPPAGSIYVAAIVTTLGVTLEDLSSFGGFFRCVFAISPAWIGLAFNAAASLIMLKYIKELRDETPACEVNTSLALLGVVVFNIYNVGEMHETLDLLSWIVGFKTTFSHEPITLGKEGDEEEVIVSGMTPWFKFVAILTIVLPKLLISIALAHYGSGFLLVSDDNESLILNTVALTFITQIDELVFESMTPGNVKIFIEKLPPQPISYGAKILGLARPYIVSAAIATITYVSYGDSCGWKGGSYGGFHVDTPEPTLPPKISHKTGGKGGFF